MRVSFKTKFPTLSYVLFKKKKKLNYKVNYILTQKILFCSWSSSFSECYSVFLTKFDNLIKSVLMNEMQNYCSPYRKLTDSVGEIRRNLFLVCRKKPAQPMLQEQTCTHVDNEITPAGVSSARVRRHAMRNQQ